MMSLFVRKIEKSIFVIRIFIRAAMVSLPGYEKIQRKKGRKMGTWSVEPFRNDSAMDWLAELMSKDDGHAFIRETINTVMDCNDPGLWREAEAIAAAAVVSAAASEPVGRVPKEAKAWIIKEGFVPDHDLIRRAFLSLQKLLSASELWELCEEGDLLKAWIKETGGIIENLRIAEKSALPQRKPRKKAAAIFPQRD